MNFRQLKLRKNPDCPVCGTHPTVTALIDYDQFCGIEKPKEAGPLEVARDKAIAEAAVVDGVPQITVEQLKAKQDAGEKFFLLDVREPHEYPIANLATAHPGRATPPDGEIAHKNDEVIVHCRSGARSQKAALILQQNGFTNVSNVSGGILAWADKIDPSMPK